ncbi:MAG TPA: hypothetical protein VGV18_05385 [Verrucomicrobiae bacterium]|nr:hypothetical protein [Verrucomicrobiae bacterium]
MIILLWDETGNGDSSSETLSEIVMSPPAKGNAYGGSVSMNHSSDLKTFEEIFGPAHREQSCPGQRNQL